MKSTLVRVVLSSLLGLAVLASVTTAASQQSKADLTGVYACQGKNPDGTEYTAVVEIAKLRDAYLVRWTQENDEQVVGVGIHRDGVLAVSYFGGSPAIATYSVGTEGRLDGQWTMGGAQGALFNETLTKLSAEQIQTRQPRPARPATPAPSRPRSAPRGVSI